MNLNIPVWNIKYIKYSYCYSNLFRMLRSVSILFSSVVALPMSSPTKIGNLLTIATALPFSGNIAMQSFATIP